MSINDMTKRTATLSPTRASAPHTTIVEISPFDSIRRTRPDQSEFWSARDLQPYMGYSKWQDFQNAIERAKTAAANTGNNVDSMFVQVNQLMDAGNLGMQERTDYELTRFACYLTFLNGDPRKPEVAAAQAYFAIRTREAEVGATAVATAAEIDTAIEQLRLCRAARDLIPASELDRRVNHVLDRGLAMTQDLSPTPYAPLSPHQFLLDKGLPAFEAELFLSPFCEAAEKAARELAIQAPECEVAVLGKRVTQRSYEFTETHRPAMETAWKILRLPTPTARGL